MNSGSMFNKSKSLEEKKALADRAFLERLRTATPVELAEIHRNHDHKSTPDWKKAAIERALLRVLRK